MSSPNLDISFNPIGGDKEITLNWKFPLNISPTTYTIYYQQNNVTLTAYSTVPETFTSKDFTAVATTSGTFKSGTYKMNANTLNPDVLDNNFPYNLVLFMIDSSNNEHISNPAIVGTIGKTYPITLKATSGDGVINLVITPGKNITLSQEPLAQVVQFANVSAKTFFNYPSTLNNISGSSKKYIDGLTNNITTGVFIQDSSSNGTFRQSNIVFVTPTENLVLTATGGTGNITLKLSTLDKSILDNYNLSYEANPDLSSNDISGSDNFDFTPVKGSYVFNNDLTNQLPLKNLISNLPYRLKVSADLSSNNAINYISKSITASATNKSYDIKLNSPLADGKINLDWTFNNNKSSATDEYNFYFVPNVKKITDFVKSRVLFKSTHTIADISASSDIWTEGLVDYNNEPYTGGIQNGITYGLFIQTTDVNGNNIQSDVIFVTPSNGLVLTAKPLNQRIDINWTLNKGFVTNNTYKLKYVPAVNTIAQFKAAIVAQSEMNKIFTISGSSTKSYILNTEDDDGRLQNNISYGLQLGSTDLTNNEYYSNIIFITPLPAQTITLTGKAGNRQILTTWKFSSKTAPLHQNTYTLNYIPYVTKDTEFNAAIANIVVDDFVDISNGKYNLTDLSNNVSFGLYLKTQDISGEYISKKIYVKPVAPRSIR